MLLFIQRAYSILDPTIGFNTSHVTLYRESGIKRGFGGEVSIHHMLLFIVLCSLILLHLYRVSIHHMLLFILELRHFLTNLTRVSIHHMLLFIGKQPLAIESEETFQYITCYSLSRKTNMNKLDYLRFNTSHVTLYLHCVHWFFYIFTGFQYITCYSLSRGLAVFTVKPLCFNTSHVTLYPAENSKTVESNQFQYITCYSLSGNQCHACDERNVVSIHHMLLFIGRGH